jgi:hypothetical protein
VQNPSVRGEGPFSLYVTGFAAIHREIGRSWNARGTYRRSIGYVPGFSDAFLSDAATAGIGGNIGPRLTVNGTVSGSRGSVGLAPSGISASQYGNDFWAYTAWATANYGLARHWALYASYVYYNYLFGSAVALPSGMSRATGRQSIIGGLTTWWPVFRR